jgi:hypothetical protein
VQGITCHDIARKPARDDVRDPSGIRIAAFEVQLQNETAASSEKTVEVAHLGLPGVLPTPVSRSVKEKTGEDVTDARGAWWQVMQPWWTSSRRAGACDVGPLAPLACFIINEEYSFIAGYIVLSPVGP